MFHIEVKYKLYNVKIEKNIKIYVLHSFSPNPLPHINAKNFKRHQYSDNFTYGWWKEWYFMVTSMGGINKLYSLWVIIIALFQNDNHWVHFKVTNIGPF